MKTVVIVVLIISCLTVIAQDVEVKVLNTNTPMNKIEKKKLETKLSKSIKASGKARRSGPRKGNGSPVQSQ